MEAKPSQFAGLSLSVITGAEGAFPHAQVLAQTLRRLLPLMRPIEIGKRLHGDELDEHRTYFLLQLAEQQDHYEADRSYGLVKNRPILSLFLPGHLEARQHPPFPFDRFRVHFLRALLAQVRLKDSDRPFADGLFNEYRLLEFRKLVAPSRALASVVTTALAVDGLQLTELSAKSFDRFYRELIGRVAHDPMMLAEVRQQRSPLIVLHQFIAAVYSGAAQVISRNALAVDREFTPRNDVAEGLALLVSEPSRAEESKAAGLSPGETGATIQYQEVPSAGAIDQADDASLGGGYLLTELLPGSAKILSAFDGRRAVRKLRLIRDRAGNSITGWTTVRIVLAGMTGRSPHAIEFRDAAPSRRFVRIDSERDVAQVPLFMPEGRWDKNNEMDFREGTSVFELSIPEVELEFILQNQAAMPRGRDPSTGQLDIEISRVVAEVAAEVQGFTLPKFRALPAGLLIERKGDLTFAQLLANATFGNSIDGQFYYNEPEVLAQERCVEAFSPIFGSMSLPRFRSENLLSVSVAGRVRPEVMRAMVERLKFQVEITQVKGRSTLQDRLDHLDALSKVAAIAIAASGHRLYKENVGLRRTQISFERRLIVLGEKRQRQSDTYRCCALGSTTTSILWRYVRYLMSLRRWIAAQPAATIPNQLVLLTQIYRALSGEDGFFLRRDELNIAQADLDWLSAGFGELPNNIFRHYLACRLRELGVSGVDIARQLGHHILGLDFGMTCLESPTAFATRLGHKIDQYMLEEGWTS